MKQWKRLAALSSAIVMAAATLTYFPNDTLQNIRLEISASAETTTEPQVWNEDNLTWTLDADGTLTISGTGAMKDYNSYDNRSPAHNNSNVKKVVIEDGVTSIGNQAFPFCQKLASVTIPDSVTSIENYAFSNCSSLTDIVIPNSVTSIGNSVFERCSNLSNITLSNNITSIGNSMFERCSNLSNITLSNNITSIGSGAFTDCRSLTSITIPDKVTSIEYAAFDGCSKLTSITIPDSITSIGDFAFRYCKSLPSITIPDSVTSIGNSAFRYCKNLPSITIPDSVTSIGTEVFQECTSLQTISLSCKSTLKKSDFGEQADLVSYTNQHALTKTAAKTATCSESGNKEYWTCEHCGKYFLSDDANPATATAVELSETVIPALKHKNATTRGAFEPTETEPGYSGDRYCPDCDTVFEKGYTYWNEDNLTWKLDADGTMTISGTGAMKNYNSDDNPSPAYKNSNVKTVVIEDGVTSIGNYAFSDCSSLTSITIPDSVTSIGYYAFFYCTSLTSITISDSVTSIGNYAFFYCRSLTSITIPDSVTSIGNYAFSNCTNLTSIKIPSSVTSMDSKAFYNCSSLKTISLDCKSTLKKSDFGDQADLVSYTLHTLKKTAAKAKTCTEDGNKEYWTCEHCGKYFLSDDTNPETAKAVELSETVIPALNHKNAITSYGASKPTETAPGYSGDLYCPDCDTVLEKGYTYWNEGNLTWKLDADGTLTISGTGAMKNYDSKKNRNPVYNNSNVKTVVIEDGVTSIGNYAFTYCVSLTSITIPDSVTSIGYYAFFYCRSLTSITIPDSVTSIGNYAFFYCRSLTSITIPDSVTSIGNDAFSNCRSLTSITIPDSVTSIGNDAFYACSSLKTISLSCGSALKKSDFGDQANLVSYALHTLKKTAAKAATCTEDGNKEYWTCEHCKKYFLSDDTNPETAKAVEQSETVIPASHKLTKVEAKDATCAENGNKEYWTCEHCGKYFLSDDTNPKTAKAVEQSEFIIPALKHKNATTRGVVEPNGKKPGYSGDRYCPDCDTVLEKGYTYWNEGNLTWKLYEDGTLTISGTGAMKNYDYNDNPSPVYNNSNVKKVVIEDGVTSIGNSAFNECISLTSITIPDSVTSIGTYAFSGCRSLTSITIPDSVTSIGASAFNSCSGLTSITIPDSVTSIGNFAFSYCISLTSITIPDSVTSIGSYAFYNCKNLTTISLSCKSSLKKSDFGDKADLVSYTNQHLLTKTAAKAATCTEDGNKEYWTCEHCGKYFLSDDTNPETAKAVEQSEFIIPASHKLTKVEAKDATCTEDGNKEYWTCEHCKKYFLSDDTNPKTAKAVELSETVIPASHKLTKVEAKDATCTENGNKAYWTCEHCKKYFLSDDTNPETAKAVELSETVIPALVQVATTTTPIKCVYGQDMNKIDLRDYVKNTDVVGEVTVKVATGSTLPDGMKLDGSNLSGKPAKAYEDSKEVTFTFTAENGSTENLTLLFLVAKADPTVEVSVSGDSHTEGDLVSELKLVLSENSTKGVVELVSEIKALVAGKNTFTWKFTPEDENNYHTVTGTVVVNAQTTTTTTTTTKATTTTTKATTTTKPNKTTTTNATTTTKPSKTTTTNATTTTKPSKTTTTNATTTTKPSKTTTTKVTTTTKPSKTTTTNATTTTKPNKTTTTNATTTTKPSKTTTTNATTTTKPSKTTTTKVTTTTKPSKTTTTKVTTTTKPSKTTTTNATTTTKPSKTTTTNATTTTKPSKTTTTKVTTTTKPSKTTTTNATTTTKPSKTTTTNATTTTKPSKTTTTKATTTNTAIPSYGDINLDGKVDIADAIFLNKYLATLIQFSDVQVANADCCQDGVLNDQDTTALMQFIILLIDDLPVQPTEK